MLNAANRRFWGIEGHPVKIYRIGTSGNISMRHQSTVQEHMVGIIVVPDSVGEDQAKAAWSYAVRYSAKGLDVPDYDAAWKLLQQRHPSWQVVSGPTIDIWYDKNHAENDKPD